MTSPEFRSVQVSLQGQVITCTGLRVVVVVGGRWGYLKSLLPEKILLLYHCVGPTDSQTDTERGQSVLI